VVLLCRDIVNAEQGINDFNKDIFIFELFVELGPFTTVTWLAGLAFILATDT
jgi:hypothetical protein